MPETKAKAAMNEEERAAYDAKKKALTLKLNLTLTLTLTLALALALTLIKAAREQKQKEEFEAEYDEMAELEKQRLRNIERNKELLRQLGLA